jgi:hypothetical protein
MAEMQTADSGGKKKGGKVRTKKMSTRVPEKTTGPLKDKTF